MDDIYARRLTELTNQTAIEIAKTRAMIGQGGSVAGSVTVDNFPTVQAVSGPLTDAELRLSPVPVSLTGALGSVTVSNFPATQPVSIAGNVPVTGTFFQSTQPVSIASSVAVTGPLTDTQLRASLVSVSVDNVVDVVLSDPIDLSAATLAALETVTVANLPATTGTPAMGDNGVVVKIAGGVALSSTDSQTAATLSIIGDTVEIALNARASVGIQMNPSTVPAFTGSVIFEGTVNDVKWEPLRGFLAGSAEGSLGESYSTVNQALIDNIFRFATAGLAKIRVRLTTLTLGSVAVTVRAADGSSNVFVNAPVPILSQRRDSDTAVAADGLNSLLYSDEFGRLKVSSKPSSYTDVTGDITAIQATIGTPVAGGTVIGNIANASNVTMFCTGTFSGVNCAFEASIEDTGENWFGIQAVRTNANTIETATGALSARPVYAWEMSVNGYSRVRVRATARTSGTQSWRFKQATYATEPIPAAQITGTQPISGTVTANGTSTITPTAPTSFNLNSAATTNLTVVKASAGTLYTLQISNNGAASAFVKFYNKTTAPVLATDIPFAIIPIPAASSVPVSYGVLGLRFATGIAYAITNLITDTDATAVAAGQVKIAGAFL